ncbi:MAG: thiamine phosphate synthase [Candidatus Eisenbacteria bacterium]|nr:thiamine phosphate synthase [Candidatus Eisenbacteria bacterium]
MQATMARRPPFRFYQITNRKALAPERLPAVLEDLEQAGLRGIQIREKDLSPGELLHLVDSILRRLRSETILLVNERVDVALARGLGVHRPEASLPVQEIRRRLGSDAWLGVSCHDLDGCRRAAAGGADFVTLSPVFLSPGKGAARGVEWLAGIAASTEIPIFALGGVTPERVHDCLGAGAYGVAAIRATLTADDPAGAMRRFLKELNG